MPEPALIPAGAAQALPAGARKLVFAPDGASVLVLNVDGNFYALEDSCPHAGASIASGTCEGHVIACPAHGLRFDIRSGQCTASPAMRIRRYVVHQRDAQLWLCQDAAAGEPPTHPPND